MSKNKVKTLLKDNYGQLQFNSLFNVTQEVSHEKKTIMHFGKFNSNKSISKSFYKPFSKILNLDIIEIL